MTVHYKDAAFPDMTGFTRQNRFTVWKSLFSMLEYKRISPQFVVDFVVVNLAIEDATSTIAFIDRNLNLVLRRYFEDPIDNFRIFFDLLVSLLVPVAPGELNIINSTYLRIMYKYAQAPESLDIIAGWQQTREVTNAQDEVLFGFDEVATDSELNLIIVLAFSQRSVSFGSFQAFLRLVEPQSDVTFMEETYLNRLSVIHRDTKALAMFNFYDDMSPYEQNIVLGYASINWAQREVF